MPIEVSRSKIATVDEFFNLLRVEKKFDAGGNLVDIVLPVRFEGSIAGVRISYKEKHNLGVSKYIKEIVSDYDFDVEMILLKFSNNVRRTIDVYVKDGEDEISIGKDLFLVKLEDNVDIVVSSWGDPVPLSFQQSCKIVISRTSQTCEVVCLCIVKEMR